MLVFYPSPCVSTYEELAILRCGRLCYAPLGMQIFVALQEVSLEENTHTFLPKSHISRICSGHVI